MDLNHSDHVGRVRSARDVIGAGALERLAATLDTERSFREGDAMPPLGHWLCFLPGEVQSRLGADGHAARGDFLPDDPDLPRRMWAGSRLTFLGVPRVGMKLVRRSEVVSLKAKEGASGRLLFVTVDHSIAEEGGPTLIRDEHDIVYRAAAGGAARGGPASPGRGAWQRVLVPDEAMLFRYSALTFNGHRIHYDKDYATGVEGYPGLVVHGPLIATLLMDLLLRNVAAEEVRSYSFRAVSPLFSGQDLRLDANAPDAGGGVELWASGPGDTLLMKAQAQLGLPDQAS